MQQRKQGLKKILAVSSLKLKRMVQMPSRVFRKMSKQANLRTKREVIK
jgi:hypothetical protein